MECSSGTDKSKRIEEKGEGTGNKDEEGEDEDVFFSLNE